MNSYDIRAQMVELIRQLAAINTGPTQDDAVVKAYRADRLAEQARELLSKVDGK
jgi:hypothetical protein